MEKKDVQNVVSGLSKEVLAEINAQSAILHSAVKVVNQIRQSSTQKSEQNASFGVWVYNLEGLQNWVHHFTERKMLVCPHCKSEKTLSCPTCKNEFNYHDEL